METMDLVKQARAMIVQNDERLSRAESLVTRIRDLEAQYATESAKLDLYLQGATLIGKVSDTSIDRTIKIIEDVINKALAVIFPLDPREIEIRRVMHNNAYPHFKAILYTGHNRDETPFKFSGSGLGQIVSFLFTLSFIDIHGGRPVLVTDELMNGLHPTAKVFIRDMIKAVSNRFQFVIVEYGLDIGKEYLAERVGDYSEIKLYDGLYYRDINQEITNDLQ